MPLHLDYQLSGMIFARPRPAGHLISTLWSSITSRRQARCDVSKFCTLRIIWLLVLKYNKIWIIYDTVISLRSLKLQLYFIISLLILKLTKVIHFVQEHNIRPKMVEVWREKFAHLNLTYSIGGQISFDVSNFSCRSHRVFSECAF